MIHYNVHAIIILARCHEEAKEVANDTTLAKRDVAAAQEI